MHALELATSLLTCGPASTNNRSKPALILPPAQIAFINNLIVHPKHTSRPETPERREIASLALAYLETVFDIAGPINADFSAAFQFSNNHSPRPRRGNMDLDDAHYSSDLDDASDEDNGRVISRLGKEESLWNCGHDFWSVAGWAFNCCVVHPARWRWWRVWLDFMLRAMDEDWVARVHKDEVANRQRGKADEFELDALYGSLLAMSFSQLTGRTNGVKWIVKALFADGQQSSMLLFKEVFPMETRDMPRGQKKRKRDVELDLDNFEYADYGDTDDELEDSPGPGEDVQSPNARPTRSSRINIEQEPDKFEHYEENAPALLSLVPFRLRLMAQLSRLAYAMPKLFVSLEDLHEQFALAIKTLPLPLFTAMLEPTSNPMAQPLDTTSDPAAPTESYAVLLKELLVLFLPPKFRDPARVDSSADREGRITQRMAEKCFVGYAADGASMEDNAKLSVLVENVLMYLFERGELEVTKGMREAVEAGVEARGRKAKVKKRRGKEVGRDVLAREVLDSSAETILMLVRE